MIRALPLILFAAAAAAAPPPRSALDCDGSEPFWSLSLGAGDAALETPDRGPAAHAIVAEIRAAGRDWPAALTLAGPDGEVVLFLRPGPCEAAMTEEVAGWSVDLLLRRPGGPSALTGCCREAAAG